MSNYDRSKTISKISKLMVPLAGLVLALSLFAGTARADTIYLATYELNYVPLGPGTTSDRPEGDHVGNTIKFDGKARYLTTASFWVYNYTGADDVFTLSLYAGDDPNTGKLLGSQTATVGSWIQNASFDFGGKLLLTDTITFILSASSGSSQFAGPLSSKEGPTIGSGVNALFYGSIPGTFKSDDTWAIKDGASSNFLGGQFDAVSESVPEPTSLMLTGFGLFGLAFVTARRGQRQQMASKD